MSDWFYAQDSQQKGPVNESRLKEMFANKELPHETLVWREGIAEWTPANVLPAFSFRAPPIPATGPRPKIAKVESVSPAVSIRPAQSALTIESLTPKEEEEELMPADPADVEKNKVFGILAYLGILFIVPLVAAKDSPFARFHANQGLILFIGAIVAYIAVMIVGSMASIIPGLGAVIWTVLWLAAYGVVLALMIMGIINAAKGELRPLPLIGHFTLLK